MHSPRRRPLLAPELGWPLGWPMRPSLESLCPCVGEAQPRPPGTRAPVLRVFAVLSTPKAQQLPSDSRDRTELAEHLALLPLLPFPHWGSAGRGQPRPGQPPGWGCPLASVEGKHRASIHLPLAVTHPPNIQGPTPQAWASIPR